MRQPLHQDKESRVFVVSLVKRCTLLQRTQCTLPSRRFGVERIKGYSIATCHTAMKTDPIEDVKRLFPLCIVRYLEARVRISTTEHEIKTLQLSHDSYKETLKELLKACDSGSASIADYIKNKENKNNTS